MQKHTNGYLSIMWLCAFLLLTIVPCCGGAEQAPPHGLVVSSVLVNPAEYTADGGRYDLFLQTVPGGKVTRLTNHQSTPKLKLGGAIREPLFSHDGKCVVFLADYAGPPDEYPSIWTGASPYPHTLLNVWEVRLDTRKVSPLTKGDFGWYVYGWSPDDRYICATYQTESGSLDQGTPIPDDIYVWDVHTRKGRKLARVPYGVKEASWSYDGKSILYQSWSDANIHSVPRQGGKPKVLLLGNAGRYGYSFSPDGRRVAYVDGDTIYVANANSTRPKPILKMSRDRYSSYSPELRWSRDSRKLVVVTNEPSENSPASTKLRVYDESTGKGRVVATVQQSVGDPIWSRNGQWLIVKMSYSGQTEKPDPKTGWHTFQREGIWAVSVADGHVVTLKEPNEETKGLDWFETD